MGGVLGRGTLTFHCSACLQMMAKTSAIDLGSQIHFNV